MDVSFNRSTLEEVFQNPRDIVQFENLVKGLIEIQQEVELIQQNPTGSSSVYATDEANTDEQIDVTYMYFAWNRIDGTGYKAERRVLATGDPAGSTTGAGDFPADLTVLSYV